MTDLVDTGCPTLLHIGERTVGPGRPVFIIAEISANHDGSFEQAAQLIIAAQKAGADAVKLQTYTADTLTLRSEAAVFQIGPGTLWAGRTLHDLYSEAFMPWDWQPRLLRIAAEAGIMLFSTPYDDTAVDFLEEMDVPAYKIASFELIDLPLIRRVAATGKPIILSTGMATRDEISEALTAARESGARELALLKCNSAYPAPLGEMNLRTIPEMAKEFGVPVGLSDHTLDEAIPVAAVALGACIVEKHITLSRQKPGVDRAFSLEPEEFEATVRAVRDVEQAMGSVFYGTTTREQASKAFRRSLFVTKRIKAGETFTTDHIRSIRPADGLPPKYYWDVIGRKARRDVEEGTPLAWDLLDPATP